MLLLGCHRPAFNVGTRLNVSLPELAAIDTLMQYRPDSALALLLDEPKDHPYYQLLLSEALYKNDYAQANRQELLSAMAYFDSLDAPFLSARCHYMNGVGYYEMDSVVPACAEYLRALEIMEEHFKELDLVGDKAKFMALTYTHLCELFSDQYLLEQATFFGKRSLSFYNKYDANFQHIGWVLNNIGLNYEVMEQLDSACFYFERVMERIPDTNNIAYRDAATSHAMLSYNQGENPVAVLERLQALLVLSENSNEYLSRCLTVGYLLYKEQQFDSAWVYLNTVFNESTTIDLKKQAAEWLVDICKAKGRDEELLVCASFLAPFANQEENNGEKKSKLTELYKTHSQEWLERQHQEKLNNNLKEVTIVFAVLSFVLLLLFYLYHTNKRKKHCLELKIKEEKQAHEIKQKALSGRLKKSNETLRETLKKIENLEPKKENQETHNFSHALERYEVFKQTAICREVFDKVEQLHGDKKKTLKSDMVVSSYKSYALSKTQLVLLSKTVDEQFPDLYASLKKQYPSLSQKDWRFCLLYLLQLDNLSICVLLQESYHTCRRYTLKLEQTFHCGHDLSDFLMEQILQ